MWKRAATDWALPAALFLVVLVGLWQTYQVSVQRSLTPLEGFLLQILVLLVGVVASFVSGKVSARGANRAQARSALHRVVALSRGVAEFKVAVDRRRDVMRLIASQSSGVVPLDHVDSSLDLLYALADAQLQTASDAILDWGEIIPEDVEMIRKQGRIEDGNVVTLTEAVTK